MNNQFTLHQGDCLETMRGMADNSVDSVVCDPPYGLSDHTEKDIRACMAAWLNGDEYLHSKKGFMNKTWDSFVPGPEVWREVFRVLRPGGYVLAFASTRTDDLMSMAMRLAGFRKHPFIGWITGSGFPKAANLSKAFDREAGAVREVVGVDPEKSRRQPNAGFSAVLDKGSSFAGGNADITAPSTDAAKQWDGWAYGLQSLKPAIEPCLMFQKPHEGRMTDNVLQWGTGAINVDGCRVNPGEAVPGGGNGTAHRGGIMGEQVQGGRDLVAPHTHGRWPANLILANDPSVVAWFPVTKSGGYPPEGGRRTQVSTYGKPTERGEQKFTSSEGSAARFFKQVSPEAEDLEAARFFYCAKASRSDRDSGLYGFDLVRTGAMAATADASMLTGAGNERATTRRNTHMCVKPTDLMAYLVRLVTPPGGTVLDPFMGSGSTGKACMREGFNFIGCEMDPEYLAIARARIEHEFKLVTAANAPAPQPDLFALP